MARQAGLEHFLFNEHHLPDRLEVAVGKLQPYCKSIQFLDEKQKILGSGGALWNARKELAQADAFVIANGDEILIPPNKAVLAELLKKFHRDQALCTILTCEHADLLKTLKAVWVDEHGHVRGFGMKAPADKLKPVHYPGYMVFSPRIFNFLPEGESNIFYEVLVKAIAQGETVSTYHLSQSAWYETGNFADLLNASKDIVENHWDYLQNVHSYFGQALAKTLNSKNESLIHHRDQKIPPSLQWSGLCALGKNVQVGESVSLKDALVLDRVALPAHSSYSDQFVISVDALSETAKLS